MKLPSRKLPRTTVIRGTPFAVKVARNLQTTREDGHFGESNPMDKEIRISNKLSATERWQVLWHEVVHMLLAQAGLTEHVNIKTEEAIVLAVEHAWPDICRLVLQAYGLKPPKVSARAASQPRNS